MFHHSNPHSNIHHKFISNSMKETLKLELKDWILLCLAQKRIYNMLVITINL